MTTKRMTRMLNWIDKNPCEMYADYRDELPQQMAQHILDGEFDKFWEEAYEVEFQASDYPEFWEHWEREFATEFGFESWDSVPEHIKEVCYENRFIGSSYFWETVCRNTRINVVARPLKRNGERVLFPVEGIYGDHDDNKARRQYLKRQCGIDLHNGKFSECYYDGTYLVVLGRVDFLAVIQSGKKPEKIWIDSDCFTLGHNNWNGSGTGGNDRYEGKRRKMAAKLFIDGTRGYGVDETYGLTGDCWSREIEIAL